MRRRQLLPTLFLLLLMMATTQAVTAAFSSLPEMLDKDELLWVSLKGCQLSSNVMRRGDTPCKTIDSASPTGDCRHIQGVLFPSSNETKKPKVLVVRLRPALSLPNSNVPYLEFSVVDLPFPPPATLDLDKLPSADFRPFPDGSHWKLLDRPDHQLAVLHDHDSQRVYLLVSSGDKIICDVYLLSFVGEGSAQPRPQFLYSMTPPLNIFANTKWSTDHQSRKFYYQRWEASEGDSKKLQLVMRAIPFPELEMRLKNGVQGDELLRLGATAGSSARITEGILHASVPNLGSFYSSIREPTKRHPCRNEQGSDYAFAVSGREYCKLRGGQDGDRRECEEELAEQAKEPQMEHGPQGWLNELKCHHIVILSVLAVLLAMGMVLCCVKWLISRKHKKQRKKFTATNRAPLIPEYIADSFQTL